MLTEDIKNTITKFIDNFVINDKDINYNTEVFQVETNLGDKIFVDITIEVDVNMFLPGHPLYSRDYQNLIENTNQDSIENDFKYLGFGNELVIRVTYTYVDREELENEVSKLKKELIQTLKNLNIDEEGLEAMDLYFSIQYFEEEYPGISLSVTYNEIDLLYHKDINIEDMIVEIIVSLKSNEYPRLVDIYRSGNLHVYSD
jgi:predicted Zn-dependent peptidase